MSEQRVDAGRSLRDGFRECLSLLHRAFNGPLLSGDLERARQLLKEWEDLSNE